MGNKNLVKKIIWSAFFLVFTLVSTQAGGINRKGPKGPKSKNIGSIRNKPGLRSRYNSNSLGVYRNQSRIGKGRLSAKFNRASFLRTDRKPAGVKEAQARFKLGQRGRMSRQFNMASGAKTKSPIKIRRQKYRLGQRRSITDKFNISSGVRSKFSVKRRLQKTSNQKYVLGKRGMIRNEFNAVSRQ